MNPSVLLKKKGINPNEPAFLITYEEAFRNLLEAIELYCSSLDVNRMTKEDIMALLSSYGSCVIKYHPENYHQERGALLENFEILKRYGLDDEDHSILDFC